jgi:uncharacterized membrane protein YbhN (UPF0104 family)
VKIKVPPILKLLIKLGITATALYFVIRKIDIHQVTGIIGGSRPLYLAAALLAFVLSKVLSAVRLNRYLSAAGVSLPEKVNLKLYLLGMYYNLFLPGGIGGDGYKIWYLNRHFQVKTARIFWAVMIDRVIGVLALFCLSVVFLYFVDVPTTWLRIAWVLIPVSVAAAWLVTRFFFTYVLSVFTITNLQSLAVQLLQLLSAWLILHSLGITGTVWGYLLVFLVSSIVAVLPVTIGGLGAREFTFMLGAQWLHLDLNLSIALSLVFYLVTAFTSFWGVIYSVGPGIRLGEE